MMCVACRAGENWSVTAAAATAADGGGDGSGCRCRATFENIAS